MIVFQLATGSSLERRVIRRALKDLCRVYGCRVVARKAGPQCRRIVIDSSAFGPDDAASLGYHLKGERSSVIALRPGLTPSSLYEVFAHELGHFFGLGHRATGLMAPYDAGARSWGKLTVAFRQRTIGELAHLLVVARTKGLTTPAS